MSTASLNMYMIGASLTWDCSPNDMVDVISVGGGTFTSGHHITAGKPLNYIRANPDEVAVPSNAAGTWAQALAPDDTWDALMFQVLANSFFGSTLDTDVETILAFIADSNPNVKVYIYGPWTTHALYASGDYTAHVENEGSVYTTHRRRHYQLVAQRLRAEGVDARLFLTGDVVQQMHDRIIARECRSLSRLSDIYRDTIHMGNIGRYLAAASLYRFATGDDPRNFWPPRGNYGAASEYAPDVLNAIYNSIDAVANVNDYV